MYKKRIFLCIVVTVLIVSIIYFSLKKPNVNNDNIDVYILFYASWCGHCKNYKPEWDKIKQKYKNSDKIKFIEISDEDYHNIKDKTVNYDNDISTIIKSINIRGYPSVFNVIGGKTNEIDRNLVLKL